MIIHKIKEKIKHGLIVFYFLDRLKSFGITLKPFYLVLEGPFYPNANIISPERGPCSIKALEKQQVSALCRSPEVGEPEKDLYRRLENGCICLGIQRRSDVLAYIWCNLSNCDSPWLKFPLESHEAYLFDARTFEAYRGGNWAAYLRDNSYRYLAKLNKTTFYSVVEAFNTPAVKLMSKLCGKKLKLFLRVEFFNIMKTNILLKRYNH
jgi:hypothetical protein